jgi:hypothetical protein
MEETCSISETTTNEKVGTLYYEQARTEHNVIFFMGLGGGKMMRFYKLKAES